MGRVGKERNKKKRIRKKEKEKKERKKKTFFTLGRQVLPLSLFIALYA